MKLICIIDDDLVHRKMLDFTLSGQNYNVRMFESGSEFLKSDFSERPFALILDHHLKEEKTGLAYLKDIWKKIPKLPVIYMTSETDGELIKQITEAKVSGYIAKDPASLVRLRTLLDGINSKSEGSWFSKIFK